MADSSTEFRLLLQDDNATSSEMQQMTRALAHTMEKHGIRAAFPSATPQPAHRGGDPMALGTLLVQLVGAGGVVVSLISVLKSYVERKPSLQFEMRRADGAELKLQAEGLTAGDNQKLQQTIERFVAAEPCPNDALRF